MWPYPYTVWYSHICPIYPKELHIRYPDPMQTQKFEEFQYMRLPNGVGTEFPSLWYSGQSRRGRTCRCVMTDMTELQHAPMYYTACTASRTPQWAAQYTLHTQTCLSSPFSPTTMCTHISHCMQDTTVSCAIQCIYFNN